MEKIAYIECASGVSGDMLVGALMDTGIPLDYLIEKFEFLPNDLYSLEVNRVKRGHLRATKFDVLLLKEVSYDAKTWTNIKHIIDNSNLDDYIKGLALAIFKGLFEAESKVHGTTFDNTHLHELGAIDCIIDIVGFLICLRYLDIKKVIFSPINVGGGVVQTAHGVLPVPAPASAELLIGIPAYSSGVNVELATPTGVCIVKHIAESFGGFPEMIVETVGYGAGSRDFAELPNVVRVFLGRPYDNNNKFNDDKITVIEANIDDMAPYIYDTLMEDLFNYGALDVFLTPIIMKKSRPAVKLTVLIKTADIEKITKKIFINTTTIGIRYYEVSRNTLKREIKTINTIYGEINLKIAYMDEEIVNISPEYEDCKALSKKKGVPIKQIFAHALAVFYGIKT